MSSLLIAQVTASASSATSRIADLKNEATAMKMIRHPVWTYPLSPFIHNDCRHKSCFVYTRLERMIERMNACQNVLRIWGIAFQVEAYEDEKI